MLRDQGKIKQTAMTNHGQLVTALSNRWVNSTRHRSTFHI